MFEFIKDDFQQNISSKSQVILIGHHFNDLNNTAEKCWKTKNGIFKRINLKIPWPLQLPVYHNALNFISRRVGRSVVT